MPNDYPEHDRMRLISDESQSIGRFLDWLQDEKGCVICQSDEIFPGEFEYAPIRTPPERLLAQYFDINLDVIENEKQQMLEELRRGHE